MEDHSAVDISIRNVGVRLNDSNVNSEMNGECGDPVYSIDNENQVTCFQDENEEKRRTNHADVSDNFREKLHINKDPTSCGLLNGSSELLLENMNCVESVNGIDFGTNIELINSHLSKFDTRTYCEQLLDSQRTANVSSDCKNCLTSKLPLKPNCDQIGGCEEKIVTISSPNTASSYVNITYLGYESESQMPDIMRLIQKDLSEPYSIYTYRYFIHNWPKLCFLAHAGDLCVGAIVCKLDVHKKQSRRGYIAMLAVDEKFRKRKIGSQLVLKAIHAMVQDSADEVVLETEITNKPALRLYENLGFVRDKRLFRYYLNGVDALRLKLWLR